MSQPNKSNSFVITSLFLGCMCTRNQDSSKNLVLNGKQLFDRIGRRIVDNDIRTICEFLKETPKVKNLYFPYNNITSKGVKGLAIFLQEDENIELINLMNNDIDGKGVLRLAKLGNKLSVTTLILNGNPIGEKGGRNLALMLLRNNKLCKLGVAQSDQTIASLVYFTAVLKHDNNTLQYLDISRVIGQLHYQLLSDHVAQCVGQMLRYNTSLTEILLQKLSLTDHDIEVLVNGLIENKTLQVLDLSLNHIGDYGFECLCEYLGTSPSLKKLFIHHNQIKDTGARAFSFKYPSSRIEFLDISENKITENGMLDILNSIRKPSPIQYLFIRGNKFGQKSCKVIYRMILSGVLKEDNIDMKIYKTKTQIGHKFVIKYQCAYNMYNDHTNAEYYGVCIDRKEMRRICLAPKVCSYY